MKIGIYSPYLDTAGGGEKYMLTIAEVLSLDHQVEVFLDTHLESVGAEKIKVKIVKLHGLDLSKVKFISAPFNKGDFFKRLKFLKNYDVIFFLTDGSLFFSTARKSFIHFQVPFEYSNQGVWQRKKLKTWKKAIYNSKFTQDIVEKSWPIKGEVIYPPVNISLFKPLKKEKQIISVGRFFGYLKSKKQELLIDSFKRLVDEKGLKGWSLHLAGSALEGDKPYIEELKQLGSGYDIFLHPNATLDELKKLYGQSSIYWHATGFGDDDPKNWEHFGITTVEAMSAGVVPVAINKGGQTEIVENGVNGFLWDTLDEMLKQTHELIKDPKKMSRFSKEAIERSEMFSKDNFSDKIKKLTNEN